MYKAYGVDGYLYRFDENGIERYNHKSKEVLAKWLWSDLQNVEYAEIRETNRDSVDDVISLVFSEESIDLYAKQIPGLFTIRHLSQYIDITDYKKESWRTKKIVLIFFTMCVILYGICDSLNIPENISKIVGPVILFGTLFYLIWKETVKPR